MSNESGMAAVDEAAATITAAQHTGMRAPDGCLCIIKPSTVITDPVTLPLII